MLCWVWLVVPVQLYHPTSCPQEAYSYVDDNGNFNMRTSYMKAFVGDDGTVHLVADKETIIDQLQAVDMTRARMLTKVSEARSMAADTGGCVCVSVAFRRRVYAMRTHTHTHTHTRTDMRIGRFWEVTHSCAQCVQVSFHWLKRVRDLTPAVTELLGVRSVWCDTKTEQNSQKFVLWAGYLLEIRCVGMHASSWSACMPRMYLAVGCIWRRRICGAVLAVYLN